MKYINSWGIFIAVALIAQLAVDILDLPRFIGWIIAAVGCACAAMHSIDIDEQEKGG